MMNKRMNTLLLAMALPAFAAAVSNVDAQPGRLTLAATMTNAAANQVEIYNAANGTWLQTLSTNGKGGAAGNARGVKEYDGRLLAAVNNGSNSVAIFKREGDRLEFQKTVTTTSAPVSVDFGNGHMYVAGATTVDSFELRGDEVRWMDGTTGLLASGGGAPSAGSTAQVGVMDWGHLLVTVKNDPTLAGTVDIVPLQDDGAISGAAPTAVAGPAGSLTPFGFSVYPDGSAIITLAHSSQDGLFRDGAFTTEIAAGQAAPCWTTRIGKYVFTVNAASSTVSRLVGTGNNIFVDSEVAASITTGGGPSDVDAAGGVLGVVDNAGGASPAAHLSLFTYDEFGELSASGAPIGVGPSANGVAIMPPFQPYSD
jgi:hypothetical protein